MMCASHRVLSFSRPGILQSRVNTLLKHTQRTHNTHTPAYTHMSTQFINLI